MGRRSYNQAVAPVFTRPHEQARSQGEEFPRPVTGMQRSGDAGDGCLIVSTPTKF